MPSITNDVVQNLIAGSKTGTSTVQIGTFGGNIQYLASAGWKKLGALTIGSLGFNFDKKLYDVETGAIATSKYSHVKGLGGKIQFELHNLTSEMTQIANGTDCDTIYWPASNGQTTIDASTVAPTVSVFMVADVSNLAAGNYISVEIGDATYGGIRWETLQILSVDVATKTITVDGEFSDPPVGTRQCRKALRSENLLGGNKQKYYQMRVPISLEDGSIFVVHMPKVGFTAFPKISDGGNENIRLPMECTVYGSSYTWPGKTAAQVGLATHNTIYPQ